MDLTYSQRSNIPKLQYWGLLKKARNEEGIHIASTWRLTKRAEAFLRGEIGLPQTMHVRNKGEIVDESPVEVFRSSFMLAESDEAYQKYRTQAQHSGERGVEIWDV
jgi:hypothetical protein